MLEDIKSNCLEHARTVDILNSKNQNVDFVKIPFYFCGYYDRINKSTEVLDFMGHKQEKEEIWKTRFDNGIIVKRSV